MEDSRREASGPGGDDLRMAPEEMLDLARRAAEILVERIEKLPELGAWDGDFQQELEKQLMEAPPDEGRPAMDVLERPEPGRTGRHRLAASLGRLSRGRGRTPDERRLGGQPRRLRRGA